MRHQLFALAGLLLICAVAGCESEQVRENQFTQAVRIANPQGVLQPRYRIERLPWSAPYGEPFAWRERVKPLPWSSKETIASYEQARAAVPPPYAATAKAPVTD